ncbi:UDP-glycosyltransferase 208A1 [Daphnia sinensis]|uniref:UDP-glycosyltransferase 208A1 n=1 Tax=Daphnia sinensis TaxID=1820382 RepID=A0AAD5L760_9CRUS|nr:UDP-glycosyltransferase 208A1 [Daphnia sinensis]
MPASRAYRSLRFVSEQLLIMHTTRVTGNVVFVLLITSLVEAYNILVLTPITSPSHTAVFKSLVTELVERGHFVTYWNGLQSDKLSTTDVNSTMNNPRLRLLTSPRLAQINSQHEIGYNDRDSPFRLLFRIPGTVSKYCKIVYEDPVFHQLMNSEEHYDLIIVDGFANDCTLYLAEVLDVPFIYLNCFPPSPWILYAIGSPLATEQFPNPSGIRDRMNFWQRAFNTVTSVFAVYFHRRVVLPLIEDVAIKTLGINNLTSIAEIENRYLSLLLINTHFSINYQLPTSPAVIEVGGMHLNRRHQRLSEDLLSFLDDSGDAGFIVVSFGSMLRGDDVPDHFCQIFLSTFARLSQRVIWKWEDKRKLEHQQQPIPSNVKTMPWLPQQELLAVYHSVPAIFLPISSDQPINAQKAEDDGYAIRINWDDLTEEDLYNAIQRILNISRYKEKVKEMSALMRDQVVNPMDQAIYWIEYVVRHQGAPHLRGASRDLLLPQRALVDVFLFLLVISLFMAYVTFRVCHFCIRTLFRKRVVTDVRKKVN